MRPMENVQDLVEEAKVRTVWWAICIFGLAYFLSHTSKSTWANIPIAFLIFAALRLLMYEVEVRWKLRPVRQQTYLSHLQKKQLPLDDPRLFTFPAGPSGKKDIDSPLVEAAIDDFISKLLQDFVLDLWYSSITPDKEFPEHIRVVIYNALGEVSGRVKEINLVDLLTRDIVELVGNHLDLYRRNQACIGVELMGTLSSDERDEKLKQHLIASKELHPALVSTESEYKVLQQLMGGVLAVVLRPQEGPMVRSIARELLTCLVMQPIMNFACPGYVNELIEYIFLAMKHSGVGDDNRDGSVGSATRCSDPSVTGDLSHHTETHSGGIVASENQRRRITLTERSGQDCPHNMQLPSADWARNLEAATQRRTQVLAPENLENLWSKGRNYNKKRRYPVPAGALERSVKNVSESSKSGLHFFDNAQSLNKAPPVEASHLADTVENAEMQITKLKRSSSTPSLENHPFLDIAIIKGDKEFDRKEVSSVVDSNKELTGVSASDIVSRGEGSSNVPKLKCRVVGAYFEKLGSKSFAVYSIVVTDADNTTWFVKRRYRNFERLHRQLKDIPNYSLHLPPKRFLSSSIDDHFVHQRCVLLDKYLQDLLSIANVAEQHEVWDFLSASSKNYSFGKSTSVMKTLAVNVDDAMDDIVRQFKGVSDGLLRKVSGSSSLSCSNSPVAETNLALTWHEEETNKKSLSYTNVERSDSLSDNEGVKDGSRDGLTNGWHSDNELNSKGFPPRVVKRVEESTGLSSERSQQSQSFEDINVGGSQPYFSVSSELLEDPIAVPPEWTPPNVSVPMLNLVDKIFQLNRRGWLRRQVFWISKQILQLMMEDAIDDWLLRQIHWLRRDDVIALGIRWVQDILWPNGKFFLKLELKNDTETQGGQKPSSSASQVGGDKVPRPGSFEAQLEAARRASDVKKMILGGAPTALVGLIGHKQYKRCAKDLYFFLQSTICLKQLAYCGLELILISIFPELRDLIHEIHTKQGQPA
ncbi:hypothetical protein H6P81_020935 [Aristolochia fimbriata]|uniref:Uncharacterized protein n=1 Tax=Aristolochia fimbriata TaxID=158543 RepID=A0AAV7DXL3_ARIFI|nr:hypothetical protein H6P81_020935 [Aristolochia fimbriata]